MARVFTDGAEFGDMLFWDTYGNAFVTATQKRTGNYSYRFDNGNYATKNVSNLSEIYLRFGFYISETNAHRITVRFRNSTTILLHITQNVSSNKLEAYVNNVLVATGPNIYNTGQWNLVEVYIKIDDSGNIQTKLNGLSDINYSGDTKPGSDTYVDNLYFINDTGSGGGPWIDDLALNDTGGGSDNSWCGDGHIEILNPITGGTYAWTGSDGDSVDNYALIDDIPPNSDTDYIKSSTATQQDIHTLSDFTGAGKIPVRVWAECRAKDNDATSGQIKLGFKTDGTVYLSASARTLSGNYARVIGDDAKVNPFDSGAWEDADLDAIQFVVECE